MKELYDSAIQFAGEYSWLVEMIIILLITAVVQFVTSLVLKRLEKQSERSHNLYDDALILSAKRPVKVGIWVLGILAAAEIAGGTAQAEIFEFVDPVREVTVVWLLIWFAVRFITFVEKNIVDQSYREVPVDETTAAAIGKLLRAVAIITGVLMALQSLGFSISGVLAFGGVGGIAVGFAARDLLANFFGAMMIFLDRPFAKGDWVRSPDRNIEGTVEEIGWRLTRIRTFDQRPLYVPNAIFTSIAVENPSRMLNRRINETIGVRYDDVTALPAIISDVEEMLRSHKDIDTERTLMVNFVEFGASSLDFFIYTFTKTVVWTEFHAIKQDVLLRIADIIASHGAEIAFPTRTLHMIEAEVADKHAEADRANAGNTRATAEGSGDKRQRRVGRNGDEIEQGSEDS